MRLVDRYKPVTVGLVIARFRCFDKADMVNLYENISFYADRQYGNGTVNV